MLPDEASAEDVHRLGVTQYSKSLWEENLLAAVVTLAGPGADSGAP
jgi:hypothetical protein